MTSMAAVSCSRRLNMVKWPQTVPVSRNFAPGTQRPAPRLSGFVTRRTFQERAGMVGDPLAERSRRSEDVDDCGGDERRPSHRCAPRVEQHVHDRARPASLRLAAELVRRQLLKRDPAPYDVTDDAHLLGLTQGLGTSEDVVASSMSVLI